jgi:hypothetical protein
VKVARPDLTERCGEQYPPSTQPEIRIKLLNEQRNLQQLATDDVGLSKATVAAFRFR